MIPGNAKRAVLFVLLVLLVVHVQAAVPPGRIMVYSTPSFANVCIDGTQCDTTPMGFSVTGNAWHTVNVTENGYLPWSDYIYVLTDQTSLVNASMQPNAAPTGIQVFLNPGGGTVCLDYSLCHTGVGSPGSISSTQFTGVSEGYHTITVNNTNGYLPFSIQPYVSQRGFVTIHIDLTAVPTPTIPPTAPTQTSATLPPPGYIEPGRIMVYSTPSFAYVCIDKTECDTTPMGFSVTGNAWHTVNISQPGYQDWSTYLYVLTHQTSMVSADMIPNADMTGIQVFVNPGGGTVCLDYSLCNTSVGSAGSTSSTTFTGLSEGYHTITVNNTDGYQPYWTQPYVAPRGFTTLAITLDPIPISTYPNGSRPTQTPGGFMTVVIPTDSVIPTIAERGVVRVYVDRTGSTVCMDSGDCRQDVGGMPGPGNGTTVFTDVIANVAHTITVTADGYEPVSRNVTIVRDQLITEEFSLVPAGPTPLPTPTTIPTTATTTSASSEEPVIGALILCSAFFLLRKYNR